MLGLKLLTTLVVLRRGSNDFEQGYEGLGPGFIDIETLFGELLGWFLLQFLVFIVVCLCSVARIVLCCVILLDTMNFLFPIEKGAKVASSSASLDLNL